MFADTNLHCLYKTFEFTINISILNSSDMMPPTPSLFLGSTFKFHITAQCSQDNTAFLKPEVTRTY